VGSGGLVAKQARSGGEALIFTYWERPAWGKEELRAPPRSASCIAGRKRLELDDCDLLFRSRLLYHFILRCLRFEDATVAGFNFWKTLHNELTVCIDQTVRNWLKHYCLIDS
jgi:hypothetical protein